MTAIQYEVQQARRAQMRAFLISEQQKSEIKRVQEANIRNKAMSGFPLWGAQGSYGSVSHG